MELTSLLPCTLFGLLCLSNLFALLQRAVWNVTRDKSQSPSENNQCHFSFYRCGADFPFVLPLPSLVMLLPGVVSRIRLIHTSASKVKNGSSQTIPVALRYIGISRSHFSASSNYGSVVGLFTVPSELAVKFSTVLTEFIP